MNLRSLSILLTLSSLYACGEVSNLGKGMDSGGTGGRAPDDNDGKESVKPAGSGGDSAGSGGKTSGAGNAPSQAGTDTGGGGGSSAGTSGGSSGSGGTSEMPQLCQDWVDTNQGNDAPSEEECAEIGTALRAAYDSAFDGAELMVAPLAGAWITGSGAQRVELVLDAQGKGTLLFGEPTDLPQISDPNEAYLSNRNAGDPEDLFGAAHLKRYLGMPYTVVAESGQGSEMSFHILITGAWDSWCQMQEPVASPHARACYACMEDEGLYSFVEEGSSCDAPEGCYAGASLDDEGRVHCGRFELCVMPYYNVCNCNADECFANPGADAGQLALYPYNVTLDPVDTTTLRLKPLSELEDQTTRYLQKQQ